MSRVEGGRRQVLRMESQVVPCVVRLAVALLVGCGVGGVRGWRVSQASETRPCVVMMWCAREVGSMLKSPSCGGGS